jgi:lipoate-protein ligase A
MDVLPRQTADAVANMSADYLLLEHYPRPERIRFRPFGWSGPAYTFGVSQPWAKYRAQVPAHYPLVRRCTGGGLVSHLDDWTFALVIPAGHPLYAADAMASYAAVHEALATALQAQGQPVKLAPAPSGERPFQSPDACAQRAEPNDLVRSDDGRKVAGAAQKRTRSGLLLEGYVWRPFLTDCDWTRFERDFTAALGAKLGSLPASVTEPVYDQLDHETSWARFNSREWNERV